ncbi:hypothetical protein PO878_09690 [Iamia majanohamensis]|uniref:Secreted protein n=1 Tax=Iamia majanohamensis TaxID=467976 RepID=A0AAE9YJ26_9ACTN|nr:hypothetical protein [Iamia majanohamensis]WCO68996.1 hypothetical protein PO878_09690 [Iamia majanohamensis]
MPKRTFWFVTGTAAGLGSSLWVQRRVRTTVERYVPEKVQERAADAARRVGPAVRDAVTEGRDAMRAREAEMRADVATRVSRPAATDRRAG